MPQTEKKNIRKLVRPAKDITHATAGDLRKKFLKLLDQGITELTVDCSRIKMIDTVGLGTLIAANNSLGNAGGKLAIINASEKINEILKFMGLEQHFELN